MTRLSFSYYLYSVNHQILSNPVSFTPHFHLLLRIHTVSTNVQAITPSPPDYRSSFLPTTSSLNPFCIESRMSLQKRKVCRVISLLETTTISCNFKNNVYNSWHALAGPAPNFLLHLWPVLFTDCTHIALDSFRFPTVPCFLWAFQLLFYFVQWCDTICLTHTSVFTVLHYLSDNSWMCLSIVLTV